MSDNGNLKIINKCYTCEMRDENLFCKFMETNHRLYNSLLISNHYQKGECLFIEGQPSHGIYMLCSGHVKLSTCSRDGKVVILHIAEPGELLGLSSTVSDSIHIATAEAIEPCQVNFIRNGDFLNFLENNAEACLNAVKQLSRNYNLACLHICALGLSATVADKLATLFLGWCKASIAEKDGVHLKIQYTHEELAQMIGTSRETVTRLLKSFRDRNLIKRKGSEMIIPDQKKLEAVIGTKFDLSARTASVNGNGRN